MQSGSVVDPKSLSELKSFDWLTAVQVGKTCAKPGGDEVKKKDPIF